MEIRGTGTLVTGASRGLGAELSRALAARGARLVLVAREAGPLEEVAASIRAAGGEAHALAADVGDKESIHKIAGAAQALVGPIRLLVHNASTLGPVPLKPLADTECEELQQTLEVNLLGPFRLTRALAGAMALGGGGLVVQVTSDASVSAYPGWGAYGVSKAALDHLGRIWAVELEARAVRFLTVDPGEMDTRMHADAMPEADRSQLAPPSLSAERIARAIERSGELASGARIEAAQLAGVDRERSAS